jgi:hypothetical protein
MAFSKRVLVVANRTADSEGLAEALRREAAECDVSFTLLVPATPGGGRTAARRQLNAALERLRGAGLEVDGTVGDQDPIVAVHEAWDPGEYDEVIVSTLSRDSSRWLEIDLPHRIAKITDAPVSHVVPSEIERSLARERMRPEPAPPPQRALGPFVGPAG